MTQAAQPPASSTRPPRRERSSPPGPLPNRLGRWARLAASGLFCAIAGLAPAAIQAQNTTFVSNTGQASRPTGWVVGNIGGDQFVKAQRFTTSGAALGYALTEVVVSLQTVGADSDPKVSIYADSIYADSESYPGRSLFALTNPNSFTANANNTFTAPAADATLAPNTNYWVVFDNEDETDGSAHRYEVARPFSGNCHTPG